jgi:ankyrin repeat protein
MLYNDFDFIKFSCNYDVNIIIDDVNENNIITKNIDESQSINDNNYKIIELLLKKQLKFINNYTDSLLCYSIYQHKSYIAKLFIEYNYDINKKDKHFLTPLIYSVKYKQYDVFKLLIDKKANINYSGAEGDDNPLIFSVKQNDEYVIDLLLKNKFDANNYNRYIETPLHYALSNKISSIETITKLIYYSDLNIQNVNGQTSLHLLCKYHDPIIYANILMNKQMDIFIIDKHKKKPIDYLSGHIINYFINLMKIQSTNKR